MTREQLTFIQILSDHLNGRKTEEIRDVDWNVIYSYARMHQVSGMIYTQIKTFLPLEFRDIFMQDMAATICISTSREESFNPIKQALHKANIPFFIVKGPMIADLYPYSQLRIMGDIDLVVHSDDRETCHGFFLKEGFVFKTRQNDREWQYYKNGMEIELHDRLVYHEAINERGQDVFFNDCWKYVHGEELDWNFHLLFLIFHLRKHLMNSGAGFRQFMDLAVVTQRKELNWEWLEENLKKTRMLDFAKTCYGFINQWFDVNAPLSQKIDLDFYEKATQKVFADGIFGFDNEENDNSAFINQIRRDKFYRLGTFRFVLQQVFPPYHVMANTKPYAYIQKMPILLPVAWIHRMIIGSKAKKEQTVIRGIMKSFTSKEKLEKRNSMLKKWGL